MSQLREKSSQKSDTVSGLFFMHIGKTAGSYINKCFETSLGEENCFAFCEHWIGPNLENKDASLFSKKRFISGHVYLEDWIAFSSKENIFLPLVSVVRYPIAQIISMLRFLDSFSAHSHLAVRDKLLPDVNKVVTELESVDFGSAKSLDAYLSKMSEYAAAQFFNHQSRFFLCSDRSSNQKSLENMSIAAAKDKIVQNLDLFAVVGINDALPDFFAQLKLNLMIDVKPLPLRINETKQGRVIDVRNPSISRVLSNYVKLDLWMYKAISERNSSSTKFVHSS